MSRFLPLLLFCALLPSTVFAHRLDECLQSAIVAIEPDGIRLSIHLTPGVAVAEQVLTLLDRDHDGRISTNETAAYAELLKHDLQVKLDERPFALTLVGAESSGPAELRTGFGLIQINYSLASLSLPAGPHRLVLENQHLATISVYLFNAAQPRSGRVQITKQTRNDNQSIGEIEFTCQVQKSNPRTFGIIVSAGALLVAVLLAGWRVVIQRQG